MKKFLFIDRDGTLIVEPPDEQIDSLAKLELIDGVIPALLDLKKAGYLFVMITNQDGLGTSSFPREDFEIPQNKMLQIFSSQGITFEEILICPHKPADNCMCRKPHLALVRPYLTRSDIDLPRSAVIGDRPTDLQLAQNMGIRGFLIGASKNREAKSWSQVAQELISAPRTARVERKTKETSILVELNLDGTGNSDIKTGLPFFDHMLDQVAKHGGVDLTLKCSGDLDIDEHHTIEDSALALGTAIKQALGDKVGVERYGWVLPMDEAESKVSMDFSGRPFLVFDAKFSREEVGTMPTELVSHFYKSLSDAAALTLNVSIRGENTHHMIESSFKAFARALKMAIARSAKGGLPSTKGTL
jgi:imidazoleglycerol-phosphate dehydratase/histidinol-phosphatase